MVDSRSTLEIELNGNEKYYDLPNSLPTNSSNPKTVKKSVIMSYGSKTLVLFYKTFLTSYSYTKLGFIEDVKGLAEALGTRNATVTFELE
ncbi:MAG TPA: cyclophilin-like fold protein [Sphingobacterium sp.]|nr:cyclophilin-like fold protein [Sphingobacterium sp.]